MEKNIILDYEQANEKMDLLKNSKYITEEKNLDITDHGLPIRYFTVGQGNSSIVITGCTHGCEIITTDFVLQLMENIENHPEKWESILQQYKLHIIPMLNPEGYLISTSAIRKLIPKDMPKDVAEKKCKEYYIAYKKDYDSPLPNGVLKRHQQIFENVLPQNVWECIPEKYSSIRLSVQNILTKYPDLPRYCLHTWSSNGNGIDIQANSSLNPIISKIQSGQSLYMKDKRYDDINFSHPGPINCPFNIEEGFKTEKEAQAISNLLHQLQQSGELFSYLNYHSTGGLIYQRPSIPPEELQISDEEITKKQTQNYLLARAYADKTYKQAQINIANMEEVKKNQYSIKVGETQASSLNDIFRDLYPNIILIELSPMGGNPIAGYGDINGNYNNTINSNLSAVEHILKVGKTAEMIGKNFYRNIQTLKDKDDYTQITNALDMIYTEFARRYCQINSNDTKNSSRKDDNTQNDFTGEQR